MRFFITLDNPLSTSYARATMSATSWSNAIYNKLFGARLQRLREAAHVRQEEVASAARACGLHWWSRATVAAIERGGRGLFAVEVAALPSVLSGAKILGADPDVTVRYELNQSYSDWRDEEADYQSKRAVLSPTEHRWAQRIFKVRPLVAGAADSTMLQMLAREIGAVRRQAREEATVRAAAALSSSRHTVPPIAVAMAAWAMWGKSLVAERDARLKDAVATPGELHALRGHITRKLQEELHPTIAGASRSRKRRSPRR